MSSVRKIAIIGAGVCGATVAFRLQEQFGNSVSITIFSDEFSPNTTGAYFIPFIEIINFLIYAKYQFYWFW